MQELTVEYLEGLTFSWTATIEQHNGVEVSIWYTALPMMKKIIKRVITVSSDYPKYEIERGSILLNF